MHEKETDVEALVKRFGDDCAAIQRAVHGFIVGLDRVVDETLICLLSGGHALLVGVPGLGKTMLVRTLGTVLDLSFSRIQFTPDLMPADITGTNIVVTASDGGKAMEFRRGPIFGNLILADEINRATPKTQSAVLEAMQESSVTIGRTTHPLPEPFFVLATQNPLEMEGTYPLPEAQLDRFQLKIDIPRPSLAEMVTIVDRTTGAAEPHPPKVVSGERVVEMGRLVRRVPVAGPVKEYIGRLVLASHPAGPFAPTATNKYVRYGASPRAAQSIALGAKVVALRDGRYNVAFADVRKVAHAAMRHRLILNFEGQAEGVDPDDVIEAIIQAVPEAEIV